MMLKSKHQTIKMTKSWIATFMIAMFGVLHFAYAEGGSTAALHPKQEKWPFDGIFGVVDRQAAQRGFQVYKEVCSACHSMHLVTYRNLEAIGFSKAEVKAIAAEASITDGPNDQGDMFQRKGLPSDYFVATYPNENAARAANNGAYPPDQSLIFKARHDGGNYIYSLLTGYTAPPAGFEVPEGQHYNPYFEGHKLAMAPPLSDGMVTYEDGTKATVEQMAHDVVVFLQWAAEPEMEARKKMGIRTVLYLLVFTLLFYFAKRRIWSRLK